MIGMGAPRRCLLPGSAISCLVSFRLMSCRSKEHAQSVQLPSTPRGLPQVEGLLLDLVNRTLSLKLSRTIGVPLIGNIDGKYGEARTASDTTGT